MHQLELAMLPGKAIVDHGSACDDKETPVLVILPRMNGDLQAKWA